MPNSQVLIAVPLLALLSVATVIDWRRHTVPNALTFGGSLFALILQGTVNGTGAALLGVVGWIACLACFLPFYMRGGMAAGDVKLMAAVGAFLGPIAGVVACVFTLVAGGVIALAGLGYVYGSRLTAGSASTSPVKIRDALRKRIPYAGAIAAGTSVVVLLPSTIPPALLQFGV